VAGAEVAQVYLGLPSGFGEPPLRLVGWSKVLLPLGAQQVVTVNVDASSSSHPLSYWDTNSSTWAVAHGDYTVFVGDSSDNLKSAGSFHIGN
jgi:beta-glucosidase